MKKKSKIFICFSLGFLIITANLFAQTKHTISGSVKKEKSGELLIGASFTVDELPNIGTVSNEYGFYSMTLPDGTYTITVSYFGYQPETKIIELNANQTVDWQMKEELVSMEEVVITLKRKNENLTKPAMGIEVLNMKEVEKLPVIFGEKDILKTITFLPGIKSAGEGNSGFSVRGGATDQNLILLDEAPVYNASHLMGFFSTFNSDAIKDVTVIKGNSPAQYGGRLSSVLDVRMKDGNDQDYYKVSGGIGLISSRLTVEGPIQKEKSSFIVSGRRTYADLFLRMSDDFKDNKLFFYDLNAKANFAINDKNKIYLSGYFGQDVLGVGKDFGIDWGNATATLRWNSVVNSKLFSNTSLIYSKYKYNIAVKNGNTDFHINSDIEDLNLKQDFSFFINPKNTLRFGFQSIHHSITPNRFSGTINKDETPGSQSLENAVYVANTFTPNRKLSIDYGLRATMFTLLGNDNTYNIYENGIVTESVFLKNGEFGKSYFTVEPRLTANYRLDNSKSLKAGYARNSQHLHLLSNSVGGSPTDQWIGNSYNTKPGIADQVSLGYSQNFKNNNYEWNVETYYKWMQNQVDFKDGADIRTAADVESELLYGVGRAYGMEMIFKKKSGRTTGWISYTLSKTERKIDGINNNEWYDARQDMTHSVSVVGVYQLTRKWSLSGLFVFNTGNAVTFPTGKYDLNGNTVFLYGERNADRMPPNHRLDLSATYEFKKKGRFESSLNFGVYNLYGRENPFSINFRDNEFDPTKTEAVQTSLFRWVPSITYNFKF